MKTAITVIVVVTFLSTAVGAAPGGMVNAIGMRFVELPPATFTMGTADLEAARREAPDPAGADIGDETPAHRVTLSQATLMARTEVTQRQWLTVMHNRPGPDAHWQRDDWERLPVVSVNWFMAQRFAEELSKMDAHYDYRLPTEAEWEYAARAGSDRLRPFADGELGRHAWYLDNSADVPQPVATRAANAFGLHDMLGNAWEWVADRYARDTYARRARGTAATVDPRGPDDGALRVRRGGSYHCKPHLVRPGYRAADRPQQRYSVLGFRVVATAVGGQR